MNAETLLAAAALLGALHLAAQLAWAITAPKVKPMRHDEQVFALVEIQNEFAGQLLIRDQIQPGEWKWIGGVRKLGRHGSATLIELPRWKAETYGLTVLKAREIGGAVSQTA